MRPSSLAGTGRSWDPPISRRRSRRASAGGASGGQRSDITDVDLPAGPAVRFHNGYWHKSRLPIVIDLPHVHVTYAVRPPAIEDAVLLVVAWTEVKFSEMLFNMADAMAQTLEIKVRDV